MTYAWFVSFLEENVHSLYFNCNVLHVNIILKDVIMDQLLVTQDKSIWRWHNRWWRYTNYSDSRWYPEWGAKLTFCQIQIPAGLFCIKVFFFITNKPKSIILGFLGTEWRSEIHSFLILEGQVYIFFPEVSGIRTVFLHSYPSHSGRRMDL